VPVNKSEKKNFDTLKTAFLNGHAALIEGKCAKTGARKLILTAIIFDGKEYVITPFGEMAQGNPYDEYTIDA
jgi:hypothetical protein